MLTALFKKLENSSRRMGTMLQRLGVDPERVAWANDGQTFRRARSLCVTCPTVDQCEAYLAGTGDAKPREFCPNHDAFVATKAP